MRPAIGHALRLSAAGVQGADTGNSGGLTAIWVDAAHMIGNGASSVALADPWRDLATHAAEPNPFAEYDFLTASLTHLAPQQAVKLLIVQCTGHSNGAFLGVIPISFARHYGRLPLRHIVNWQHANAFLGTPLVRRGQEAAFWMAALPAIDAMPDACGLIHFTGLSANGPVHIGLIEAASRLGRACDSVQSEDRAILIPAAHNPDSYWATAVRSKKRKELRRQAARLNELGAVEHRHGVPDGQDIDGWINDFLALEAAGWKGAKHSAMGSDARKSGFFRDVLVAFHAKNRLDLRSITLNGRPIAMLMHIIAGNSAFAFKTAFDEKLSAYSPGVLIQQDNLAMITRPGLAMIDSCAAPNHPMINSLWMERRRIVRVSLQLGGPLNRMRFSAVRALENLWGRLRGRALPNPLDYKKPEKNVDMPL